MQSRRIHASVIALMALGVLGGSIGMAVENDIIGGLGLFLTVAAMPLLISMENRRAERHGDAQLADTFNAGYRLALEHVALGLLDQHAAPTGPGDRAMTAPSADNVIRFRPPATGSGDDKPERKAQ